MSTLPIEDKLQVFVAPVAPVAQGAQTGAFGDAVTSAFAVLAGALLQNVRVRRLQLHASSYTRPPSIPSAHKGDAEAGLSPCCRSGSRGWTVRAALPAALCADTPESSCCGQYAHARCSE